MFHRHANVVRSLSSPLFVNPQNLMNLTFFVCVEGHRHRKIHYFKTDKSERPSFWGRIIGRRRFIHFDFE